MGLASPNQKTSKREARVLSLEILSCTEFNEYFDKVMNEYLDHLDPKPAHTTWEFASGLVTYIWHNKEELDKRIQSSLKNWDIGRIAKLDLLLIRMALSEVALDWTPPKVAINEAIELAKIYSTTESAHFINGVLDPLLSDELSVKK